MRQGRDIPSFGNSQGSIYDEGNYDVCLTKPPCKNRYLAVRDHRYIYTASSSEFACFEQYHVCNNSLLIFNPFERQQTCLLVASPYIIGKSYSNRSKTSGQKDDILNWVKPGDTSGEFKRQQSVFRDSISKDPGAQFPAEKDRYHLYVSYACPWGT